MAHKNRTLKGDELMKKHQECYNKWWLNKNTKYGKIVNVEYIGNSVYGIVEITLQNGLKQFVSSRESFRPRKSDLEILN